MTRHIIDTPKAKGMALKRFLRIERQQAGQDTHSPLARVPRGRNPARRLTMFSRIERRGADNV